MNEELFLMNLVEPVWIGQERGENQMIVAWLPDKGGLQFSTGEGDFSFRLTIDQFIELTLWATKHPVI